MSDFSHILIIPLHLSKLNRTLTLSKVLTLENTSKNENIFLFVWYFAHLIVPLSP